MRRADPSAIDYFRCLARVWNEGHPRQCSRAPKANQKFCAAHLKSMKHGSVEGELPCAVETELMKFHQRQSRLKKNSYQWYSRIRLFEYATSLHKTVEDLTEEEFEHGLHVVNRYYQCNASYRTNWNLEVGRGPQCAADRHNPERVNYLGTPRRHK